MRLSTTPSSANGMSALRSQVNNNIRAVYSRAQVTTPNYRPFPTGVLSFPQKSRMRDNVRSIFQIAPSGGVGGGLLWACYDFKFRVIILKSEELQTYIFKLLSKK